jgi:cell division protein FtsB
VPISGIRPASRQRRAARPVLTGRALVLGAIGVLLLVLLASPVHRFLDSRSAVGSAATQLHADRSELATLRAERAQWSDPGFLQRQARVRLQFAMPGDTVYVVVRKGQRSGIEKSAGTSSKQAAGSGWNSRLWDSVRAAAQ